MKIEVKVPSVGESVSTADIENWEKQTGDLVKKGEVLVILETDKASMEIPAEQDGRLETLKSKGEQVSVDEVIAFIETDMAKDSPKIKAEDKQKLTSAEKKLESSSSKATPENLKNNSTSSFTSSPSATSSKVTPTREGISLDENIYQQRDLFLEDFSPAVRHLIASSKLNPSFIEGTGRGGRLTKENILNYLAENPEKSQEKTVSTKGDHSSFQSDSLSPADVSRSSISSADPSLKPGQRREAMTRLRRVTAERLVQSQHNTATLTTFNEVDLSRIIEIRKNYQEDFIKKYGFKLGFMSFFVKAVVVALKEFPKINAFIEGTDIIYNDFQHIGIAVSTEKGLVVPVLFHAERLSLSQIEGKIIECRDKALARKLSPDDLLGGTFTISNGGVFGSLLSTPILNPPQSGILGMHKIEQRPVVKKGQMEIRPMMYLAFSYDHRMIDGRESVSFLVKVKEGLEEPPRLLIDI